MKKPISAYFITRYTSANKVYENHALTPDNKILCKQNHKQFYAMEYNYEGDLGGEVSCKKCLKILEEGKP